MTPTVSMLIEVKDMPLADMHRLFHAPHPGAIPEPAMRIQPDASPPLELQREIISLRATLETTQQQWRERVAEIADLKSQLAEQPTWNDEAPKDRLCANILQAAPQDLLNLSVFLEKLDDQQIDTVWVAAVLDALRETLPGPSVRGLTLCLNHVRERYRRQLTGAEVTPMRIVGGSVENERPLMDEPGPTAEPPRERAERLPRAELLAQMLAAVPNVGDRVLSTHWPTGSVRTRAIAIATTDDRFNVIPGEKAAPGKSPTAATIERR